MQIGFSFNHKKPSGILTKFFTGCYCYHTFFYDKDTDTVYDMNLLRRRLSWSVFPSHGTVYRFYDVPEKYIQKLREQLEQEAKTDKQIYGFADYLLFAVRPIYHLFGKSTRNANGVICSEMVNDDLRKVGFETPWDEGDAPPSPCDMAKFLLGQFATETT